MVRILKIQSIHEFIKRNPEYKKPLEAWFSIVNSCDWDKPADIVAEFGAKAIDLLGKKDNKASTVSCERVVFDIKGNHIRIIAKYQFHPKLKQSILYLKWIGSHTAYDKLCKKNQQFEIEMFT